MTLNHAIESIPGVGPKKASILIGELGIRTVGDLLSYFPYKYIDRSRFYKIAECTDSMAYVQIKGIITNIEKRGEGRSLRLVATLYDGHSTIELIWFKGLRYVEGKYRLNVPYIVFGKPSRFGQKLNIAHPEIEEYNQVNLDKNACLQAHYNTTEKMKTNFLASNAIRKIIMTILADRQLPIEETLSNDILQQYSLMPRHEAIRIIHLPQNTQELYNAQRRLKFEELFYIQLSILRQSKLREQKYKGFIFSNIGKYFNGFYKECLPFPLTDAQKRVLKEIRADVGSGKQMNRLVQGDVGSGKTIVALMSCLMALDNGYQAVIMAPTEILATQHWESISKMVEPIGINVKLLTGSTKKRERVIIDEELRNGSLHILIGTHALIEDNVQFQNLGMAIIDEQHRFGVAQRAKLWTKNICPPHILVMTATPIPRTLAMTIYGDLDVSVIDQLPPGRKPIITQHYFDNHRDALNRFIYNQVMAGRQVYVVYPLIEESEKLDLKNLESGYYSMQQTFPNFNIALVHGKMKADMKEAAMTRFASGEAQIMMATTVIEVGVNVPNATVMIIESAERFGLSQLHQLRGRVGRGSEQSYCILMSSVQLSNETRKRLQIMVDTNDGFQIAEADLNLRGPGDIDGTIQSGLPFDLKIANLATDGKILQAARIVAKDLLEKDPELQDEAHRILLTKLNELQKSKINWGTIS